MLPIYHPQGVVFQSLVHLIVRVRFVIQMMHSETQISSLRCLSYILVLIYIMIGNTKCRETCCTWLSVQSSIAFFCCSAQPLLTNQSACYALKVEVDNVYTKTACRGNNARTEPEQVSEGCCMHKVNSHTLLQCTLPRLYSTKHTIQLGSENYV